MGDTDLSFEALKRFEEIETRLSALEEAGTPEVTSSEEVPEGYELVPDEPVSEEEETTTSRGRKKS